MIKNIYYKLKDTENNTLLTNHLLVLFFFFITSSASVVKTIFFILIFLFILRGNYLFYIKDALKNKVVLAFFMYFMLHIISIFFSNDILSSMSYTKNMKVLLFPILLFSYIRSEFIPRFFVSFIVGMLFSEILSYGIIFELWNSPFYNNATPSDPTPFFNHLFYGIFLAFATSLLVVEINYIKNLKFKIFSILFFITMSLNIFFNAARSGFYLYIISITLTVYLLNKNKFKSNLKYIFIMFTTIILFSSYFSPTFQQRIFQAKNEISSLFLNHNYHSSFGTRIKQQIDTLLIIKEDPILLLHGVGAGRSMAKLRDYTKANPNDKMISIYNHLPEVHNQYAVSLLQFGFLGLIFLLNIFYQILKFKQSNLLLRIPQIVFTVLLIFFSIHDAALVFTVISIFFIFVISVTLKSVASFSIKDFTLKGIFYYIIAGLFLLVVALNS